MKSTTLLRRSIHVRVFLEHRAAQAYAFLLDTAGIWAQYLIDEGREPLPLQDARREFWRAHRMATYSHASETLEERYFLACELRELYNKIRRGHTLALLMAAGEQPERSAR